MSNDGKKDDEVIDNTPFLDDGTKTVPLIALELLSRSTTETANTIEWCRKMEEKKAAELQARLDRALKDTEDVRRLHDMLQDPFYASRLIRLLHAADEIESLTERPYDDGAPDSDRGCCGRCGCGGGG